MFGIGLMEFAVIGTVAVLIFGPDKLPVLARQAGQLLRQMRRLADRARDDLRSELGAEYADLELKDLDPRAIVRRHIAEALAEEGDQPSPPSPGTPGSSPVHPFGSEENTSRETDTS